MPTFWEPWPGNRNASFPMRSGVRALPGELALEVEGAGLEALVGPDHVHDRVDLRQVGEGLGEVPEVAPRAGVDLLGVEPERARVRQQLLAERPAALDLSDLH